MNIASGDRVAISGGSRRMWVISAVNNRVVKYFDENNNYGQMPLAHLEELINSGQAQLVRGADTD